MGIEQQDFINAFVAALGDDAVIKKMDSLLCQNIHVELSTLQKQNASLLLDIKKFMETTKQLQKEVSQLTKVIESKEYDTWIIE